MNLFYRKPTHYASNFAKLFRNEFKLTKKQPQKVVGVAFDAILTQQDIAYVFFQVEKFYL